MAKQRRVVRRRRKPFKHCNKRCKKDPASGVVDPEAMEAPPMVIPPTPEEEIAAHARAIRELEAKKLNFTQVPTEVTCVIPTFDAFVWLGQVLRRLRYGFQSVPMSVHLCDNGSTDPLAPALQTAEGMHLTQQWLQKQGFRASKVLAPVPQHDLDGIDGTPLEPQQRINKSLEHVWKKLTMSVETPYILYIDGDVDPPVDCVRTMMEMLEKDQKLALVGVMYDPAADHVQMGCTMGRTVQLQRINWQSMGCPCRWLNYELRRQGWKVAHVPPVLTRRKPYGDVKMVAVHNRMRDGRGYVEAKTRYA